jgi:LysR family hydrogen peroxide-inducible transcriptional activator
MPISPRPNDISLRQLEYVVAVADTLGFHKAAERCHVSQPTLSTQVQQVESVLGVTIFERGARRVLVTSAGADVVARARRVLVEMGDLVAAATRVREPFSGTLCVGVIPTVAPYLLPEIMPTITTTYPRLSLRFREEKTQGIVRELAEGTLDAGLLALEAELGVCTREEILQDPLVAALPKGHPLARKKQLSIEDLEGTEVLLLDEAHCFGTLARSLCARAGATEACFRATSLSTLAQMVSSGAGVTLLPRMAITVENRRGQLVIRPFTRPALHRTIVLIWRPGSPFASTFRALADTLRTRMAATATCGAT